MKRISWKKGMRLTDEVLRDSDNCVSEFIGNVFVLATAGRFGLFPSLKPFELSLNIAKGVVDVESLNCHAVTKDGNLIDVSYDTRYTNTFDTRVQIPEDIEEKELILIISRTDQWNDTNNGYEEPVCSFSLISPNSPVPADSLPIARLVDEYGWRVDDSDFVPPCLFVTSHPRYMELLNKFSSILSETDAKARKLLNSSGKEAMRIFWPVVQQIMVSTEKEYDMMTPMALMASVQKYVSAFTCACELDDYIELSDAEKFRNYVNTPYNYKDCYLKIKEGLELCYLINEKISKLDGVPVKGDTIEAPTIDSSQLIKKCINSKARVQVTNKVPGATVYYTVDGKEPSLNSKNGQVIQIESGFNNSRKKEPNKVVVVKVKAFLNGISSNTNSYEIILEKDIERWSGLAI